MHQARETIETMWKWMNKTTSERVNKAVHLHVTLMELYLVARCGGQLFATLRKYQGKEETIMKEKKHGKRNCSKRNKKDADNARTWDENERTTPENRS